jgi:hypothetical protein
MCTALVGGFAEAVAFIHAKPTEAGAILKKRIPNMDDATFIDAFEATRRGIAKSIGFSEAGLKNAQELMVVGGMIKPEERLASFETIYTNAYVK